jgi:RNA polymerase sigma-70 factor (ECF subfamily)
VDDALHDAAVNALAHLESFDPALGSAGTWLWTLTHHCAVNLLRRRTTRPTVSLFHDDGRTLCDPAGDDEDPADLAEEREDLTIARRWLDQALALCGPEVRRAWELRHDHGMQYSEIAEVMDQPVGTIATWIHRVKKVARRLAADD